MPDKAISAEAAPAEISDDLVQAIEDRVIGRLGMVLAELAMGLQRTETKLDALAPLTESLSLAHMDTREKIQELDATIVEMQSPGEELLSTVGEAVVALDAELKELKGKVNGALAPFMESFAIAQIDMKAQLGSLDTSDLRAQVKSLQERDDSDLRASLKNLEGKVRELTVQKAPKEAASQLNNIPACLLDTCSDGEITQRWQSCQTGLAQDAPEVSQQGLTTFEQALMSGAGAKKSPFMKQVRPSGKEAHEGSDAELTPTSKSRSKKAHKSSKLNDGEWVVDPLSVPFARTASTIGSRTLERKAGGRSLPYLPPMF